MSLLTPVRRRSPTGPLPVNLPAAVEPVRVAEIHFCLLECTGLIPDHSTVLAGGAVTGRKIGLQFGDRAEYEGRGTTFAKRGTHVYGAFLRTSDREPVHTEHDAVRPDGTAPTPDRDRGHDRRAVVFHVASIRPRRAGRQAPRPRLEQGGRHR